MENGNYRKLESGGSLRGVPGLPWARREDLRLRCQSGEGFSEALVAPAPKGLKSPFRGFARAFEQLDGRTFRVSKFFHFERLGATYLAESQKTPESGWTSS